MKYQSLDSQLTDLEANIQTASAIFSIYVNLNIIITCEPSTSKSIDIFDGTVIKANYH